MVAACGSPKSMITVLEPLLLAVTLTDDGDDVVVRAAVVVFSSFASMAGMAMADSYVRFRMLSVVETTTEAAVAATAAAAAAEPPLIVLLVVLAITDEVAIAENLAQRTRQFS